MWHVLGAEQRLDRHLLHQLRESERVIRFGPVSRCGSEVESGHHGKREDRCNQRRAPETAFGRWIRCLHFAGHTRMLVRAVCT